MVYVRACARVILHARACAQECINRAVSSLLDIATCPIISERYGCFADFTYYYAPEYGPTTQRFHLHALVWFRSELTSKQIKSSIAKAWPFCRRDFIYRYTQVARCASSYVSSYLTSDLDVPPFLRTLSPLRSSHSLHFGFDNESFQFKEIVEKFLTSRTVTYTINYNGKDGELLSADVPYPKYVLHSCFPRLKGWSRINQATRIDLISHPEKYRLSDDVAYISDNGTTYYYALRDFDFMGRLHSYYFTDSNQIILYFSKDEWNYFFNAVSRALYSYTCYLGSSDYFGDIFHDYALLHNAFWNRYKSYIYYTTQQHQSVLNNLLEFTNIAYHTDLLDECPSYFGSLHPDHLPYNQQLNNTLIDKYSKHLKTRKLNSLYG